MGRRHAAEAPGDRCRPGALGLPVRRKHELREQARTVRGGARGGVGPPDHVFRDLPAASRCRGTAEPDSGVTRAAASAESHHGPTVLRRRLVERLSAAGTIECQLQSLAVLGNTLGYRERLGAVSVPPPPRYTCFDCCAESLLRGV